VVLKKFGDYDYNTLFCWLFLLFLAAIQLLVTAVLGLVNMRFPCFMYQTSVAPAKKEPPAKSTGFYRVMFFVGSMR